MSISTNAIKDLREKTGAGMMDCKKALLETDGDFEKAVDWLRKKGLASAAKKAGRTATEGLVHAYIHSNNRVGVLLEVNCETDFVARNNEFKTFVNDIAMHIAAMAPLSVSAEDISEEVLNREKAVLAAKNREQGKKEEMIDKIVDGQIKKFVAENCLLEQKFVKNQDISIKDYLNQLIAKLGENMVIRRFERYNLGEGLAKKESNFAEEVAQQIKGK